MQGINNSPAKMKKADEFYNKFYKASFPNLTKRLGIILKPIKAADFHIRRGSETPQPGFDFGDTTHNPRRDPPVVIPGTNGPERPQPPPPVPTPPEGPIGRTRSPRQTAALIGCNPMALPRSLNNRERAMLKYYLAKALPTAHVLAESTARNNASVIDLWAAYVDPACIEAFNSDRWPAKYDGPRRRSRGGAPTPAPLDSTPQLQPSPVPTSEADEPNGNSGGEPGMPGEDQTPEPVKPDAKHNGSQVTPTQLVRPEPPNPLSQSPIPPELNSEVSRNDKNLRHMTLQEWLDTNHISARDFAAQLGKHESILSRILAGRQAPSYLVVRRVAELTKGAVGLMDWPVPTKKRDRKK
jgi:hypothetical protein